MILYIKANSEGHRCVEENKQGYIIDDIAPIVNVEYSTIDQNVENVTVTITANEPIQEIEGWTLSSDKQTLTKEYSRSTEETIIIKDMVGNETNVDVKVVIKGPYSEIYEIDKGNKYILRVLPETTVNTFASNINIEETYRVVNLDGKEINGEEYVTTGSKLITEDNEEYRISVIGDLNKNGTMTLADISIQRKHILDIEILENEVYQAGDLNKDGEITLNDLSKMRKVVLGIENLVS